ncbi:MAG: peptidase M48 [Flavobacteriaceae bacterium]|nr:MAG: peptidase M48 [Flavobacteriaceae bacterium]
MTASFYYYLILGLLSTHFIVEQYIAWLNTKNYAKKIPDLLVGIYNKEAYKSSQLYKNTTYNFGLISSTFSFILIVIFFLFDGFSWVDTFAKSICEQPIGISLLFFGVLGLANEIITVPFAYYQTFYIEESVGFNNSTKTTFWMDKIKGLLLGLVLGGLFLAAIHWFYLQTSEHFWLYAWGLITCFSLLINLFYAQLIVPIFNKQTPLEAGELKNAITIFANSVGFSIHNIYVIDGSKRSTKANAYFSGFGPRKRITLYDTLLHDLTNEEIVAVLAHEIGHYKQRHIIYTMILSTLVTGVTFYILSLLIGNDTIAMALGVEKASFHIGLVAFGFLYTPISEVTGIILHAFSRRFEFEADDFAKKHGSGESLISALKTLSKKSLSNLTPHPWYVFMHYSHPSLLERIKNLKKHVD